MQTDTCMTSGGGTSDSVQHISSEDQQNGEFQKKPVKEEKPEDDEHFRKRREYSRVQSGAKLLLIILSIKL